MYKTSFPTYGSSSVIIEIRSHQQLARHFKVIGHWKKDLSDREEVISASKDQAHMICTMMNAGHSNFTEVLKGLEAQNLSLQERIEIIADVNWRTALGWKIAAFITGTLAGIALAAFVNQLVY